MVNAASTEIVNRQISHLSADARTVPKAVPVYRIVLQRDEDGRIVVTCPDLQGVVTDGKDYNEAIKNAFDAVQSMLEALGMDKDFMLTVANKSSV